MSKIEELRNRAFGIPQKLGPHPDYENNLRHSEQFCENVKKSLLNGMNVKISDSEHLKKAILMISWNPGIASKRGNYATPVSLHQYSDDFKNTATNVFNCYMKVVTDYHKANPSQPEFIYANLKV